MGASEVIMYVGQLELIFNEQAPDGIKSFGSSLFMASISLGNYAVQHMLVNIVTSFHSHGFSICSLTAPAAVSCPCHAQRHRNISLGSSLTPLGPNTSWLSPSGEFAFGFRPLPSDSRNFLLAIWFEKIASRTIVWYANGNYPVQDGAKVELTSDGRLSLEDHAGSEVWSAGVSNASHAAMLNTGNFVLVDAVGQSRWESFQFPSDTILPSQVLSLGKHLSARLMEDDYSAGRFTLQVQTDGNLVFYTVSARFSSQYGAYWASNTVGNGTRLTFNESGSIYFEQSDNSVVIFTSGGQNSMRDYYQRGTLDADGVFRQYVHPRNNLSTRAWGDGWTSVAFQPPNICEVTNAEAGSGACGFNSYCRFDDNQQVNCECPPQFSFLDPARKYEGCKPDFALQSCQMDASQAQEMFELSVLNVDWPAGDYEYSGTSVAEDQCRQDCLADCLCAVATFGDAVCRKKRLPLSIGRVSNGNIRAFFKVPRGNSSSALLPPSTNDKESNRIWILLGPLLVGVSVFILLAAVLLVLCSSSASKRSRELSNGSSLSSLSLRCFTFGELKEATNNFREEIGKGASGIVYKGFLQDEAGTCVAIKKLDKVFQETEKEFTNEVKTIAQTHHKNLVRLLGFCCEGTERLLVYEYMCNGSLMSFLLEDERPDWNTRIQIALGIARGLQYLHEECFSQVIHCDIKPQNILLDENFAARISDFGLAKLLKTGQTRTNTNIRGTKGYVAPEWFKSTSISAKVDVYSFGVVLLEIVCCRKNVDVQNEEDSALVFQANDCFREGRLDILVEGDEQAMRDMKKVERLVRVSLWCIQEDPSLRPTMQKVTQMLDGASPVPVPPDPSSYISSL
ncbi:G-type lectin S-receptor-like serine/threonine-protein kinase LECRK3 [Curcuma longa]|uniref:G-type lectin S-receptor-like serine/threonine-protein kinase LECRK3 n=1 Tax=Curcuma longa TaxID=136217 RepID=UPI003D9DF1F3